MNATPVADLSPLRGLRLTSLRLHGCEQLTDLSPLADCKELNHLTLPPNAKDIEFLRTLPNLARLSFAEDKKDASIPDKTAAEFWKEYDQPWLRALRESARSAKISPKFSGIDDCRLPVACPLSPVVFSGYRSEYAVTTSATVP